jgi:hypothetical protein
MTVLETINAVRDLLSEPVSNSAAWVDTVGFYKDSTLLRYFNLEQKKVGARLMDSHENYFVTSAFVSITANTDVYTLPTASQKIVRIEDVTRGNNNAEPLIPMSLNDKDQIYHTYLGRSSTGFPKRYAIMGKESFIVRPIPGSTQTNALKVYFEQKMVDLTAGSQTTIIPEEFHEILIWGVYKRALFQQEASRESIQLANVEYNRLVKEMINDSEQRQTQRSRKRRRRR